MLAIDLTGKRALVAGVADDGGFGFAIAKSLAEAGATICLGSWPPALGIFTKLLERGKLDASMQLSDGRKLGFERVYPLDAAYDALEDAPQEIRENKRYKEVGDFSVRGMAERIRGDFGDAGARHRGAQPRQRAGGQVAAGGHEPAWLPRGGRA